MVCLSHLIQVSPTRTVQVSSAFEHARVIFRRKKHHSVDPICIEHRTNFNHAFRNNNRLLLHHAVFPSIFSLTKRFRVLSCVCVCVFKTSKNCEKKQGSIFQGSKLSTLARTNNPPGAFCRMINRSSST